MALIGLGLAIALGRPGLALIAAPSLVALLPVLQWGVRPGELQMTLSVSEERCFEGDDLEVVLEVKSSQVLGMIAARYGGTDSGAAFGIEPALVAPVHATNTAVFRWTVTPRRWGNWVLGDVQIQVRSRGLGWGSRASVSLPGLKVFPPKISARDLVVPANVLSRIGSHTGRRPGAGMEFIGTRDYVPGDSVRHINWPASSRRQTLVVNQHAAERATEVVVLVDTTGDGALANGSILESAVRVARGSPRPISIRATALEWSGSAPESGGSRRISASGSTTASWTRRWRASSTTATCDRRSPGCRARHCRTGPWCSSSARCSSRPFSTRSLTSARVGTRRWSSTSWPRSYRRRPTREVHSVSGSGGLTGRRPCMP